MPPKQLNRTVFDLMGALAPKLLSPRLRAPKHDDANFLGGPRRGRRPALERRAGAHGASQTERSRTIPSGICTNPRTCVLINLYSFG